MKSDKPDLAAYYASRYPLTFARTAEAEEAFAARYEEAMDVARRAAALLKSPFGARKVVVFGSLASRSRFNRWSDIDLAAWGIPERRFYAAVGAVTALSSRFKIDLVDPADCRESLKETIEREGVEL